jgi:hypothetical protein
MNASLYVSRRYASSLRHSFRACGVPEFGFAIVKSVRAVIDTEILQRAVTVD